MTFPEQEQCLCPDVWVALISYGAGPCAPECPSHDDCGGWTWDPPCGGCDRCILDQRAFYDSRSEGGNDEFGHLLQATYTYRQAQVMNA